MSDVDYKSVLDSIQQNADAQRYRPKQLIHIVRAGPNAMPLNERQTELFDQLKQLIEIQVMSTELNATEGRRQTLDRNLFHDKNEMYTQEFKFAERVDKKLYNIFREMRAGELLQIADVEILIIEPSADYTKAADAWLFRDLTLSRIRNAHVPRRNLAEGLDQDPAGKDFENFATTIALYGELNHQFELMADANLTLDRMNLVAFNPNEHPAFLGEHSHAVETPADPTSTAHCDVGARL